MGFVGVGIFANGAQHPRVGEAAAENATESGADFIVGGVGLLIENGFGGEDDAAKTESTLRGAFVNEGLLQGVGMGGSAQAFESGDISGTDGADGLHARPDYLTADDDGARAALGHAAAEPRAAQVELIIENE
jgi:hypothetical protein